MVFLAALETLKTLHSWVLVLVPGTDGVWEDSIRSHITTPLHDQNCEKHICAGAPYVLAPGYEDRVKQQNQREANKQERQRKQLLGDYKAEKRAEKREKEYRANQLEVQRGKRAKLNTEPDVQLPHDLSERLTVQEVLKPKDPRLLSDDMVFTLLRHGRSLELMDEMRPLWRTYSAVGGHVCGTHQAEVYVQPTIIKQEQEEVLFKIHDDVDRGSGLSLLFDKTTYCIDDHPVNIILGTRCHICYITTTFIARNEAVNGATVLLVMLSLRHGKS